MRLQIKVKMKILLVISKFLPEYSGPAYRIFNTYQRIFDKKKIHIEIICQSEEKLFYEEYQYKGFKVTRFSSINSKIFNKIIKQFYFFYLLFKIYFISKKFDIFHVVGNSQITNAALYVSRLKKKPLFYELVNASAQPYQKNKILDFFFKLDLKTNCIIVCLSHHLAKKCYDINLLHNVWIKPNPVNLNVFNLENKSNKKFSLLYISQFLPRKNQIFLVEVMKYLPKNYKLILAGPVSLEGKNLIRDSEYLDKIKLKIKENNLSKNIEIISSFVESDKFIKNSSLYLLPSYNEGLGTTLLESLACGIPVLANKNEYVFKEYIIDNFNGKLLELDPELWAKEIIRIHSHNNFNEVKIYQNIMSKVSSTDIDNKIFKSLEYLINAKYNDTTNINKVLK